MTDSGHSDRTPDVGKSAMRKRCYGRYNPSPAQLERDTNDLERLLAFALNRSAPTPTQLLMANAA